MKHCKNIGVHDKHVFLHFGVWGVCVFGYRGTMGNVYK